MFRSGCKCLDFSVVVAGLNRCLHAVIEVMWDGVEKNI